METNQEAAANERSGAGAQSSLCRVWLLKIPRQTRGGGDDRARENQQPALVRWSPRGRRRRAVLLHAQHTHGVVLSSSRAPVRRSSVTHECGAAKPWPGGFRFLYSGGGGGGVDSVSRPTRATCAHMRRRRRRRSVQSARKPGEDSTSGVCRASRVCRSTVRRQSKLRRRRHRRNASSGAPLRCWRR